MKISKELVDTALVNQESQQEHKKKCGRDECICATATISAIAGGILLTGISGSIFFLKYNFTSNPVEIVGSILASVFFGAMGAIGGAAWGGFLSRSISRFN